MLIPGLGVSYEIFLPLVDLLKNRFLIVAVEIDGFTIGVHTEFTSIDDQARQVIEYINEHHSGSICCAYGLSLGGKILSRVLERNEVKIEHSILDAAPLLPLPKWMVGLLRHVQAGNVWTCYHWTGFWRWVFHSHYFDACWTNAEKSSHTAAPKRFLTDISQSIQTDWNQSPILRFTFGMARKKHLSQKLK